MADDTPPLLSALLDGAEGLILVARNRASLPATLDSVTRAALTKVGEGADLAEALESATLEGAGGFLVANEEAVSKLLSAYKALK